VYYEHASCGKSCNPSFMPTRFHDLGDSASDPHLRLLISAERFQGHNKDDESKQQHSQLPRLESSVGSSLNAKTRKQGTRTVTLPRLRPQTLTEASSMHETFGVILPGPISN
jgi:hypothetical protein